MRRGVTLSLKQHADRFKGGAPLETLVPLPADSVKPLCTHCGLCEAHHNTETPVKKHGWCDFEELYGHCLVCLSAMLKPTAPTPTAPIETKAKKGA